MHLAKTILTVLRVCPSKVLAFCALALVLCQLSVTRAQADEPAVAPDELAAILKSLEEQGQKARCARFVWNEEHTIWPKTIRTSRRGFVPENMVHTTHKGISFQFDGNKWLYKYFPQDSYETGRIISPSSHAFDGQTLATYDPPGEVEYARGLIHSFLRFQEFGNLNIWPFLFAFRPVDAEGVGLGDAAVSAERGADGMLVLRWKVRNGIREFYLDPAHGHRLTRYEHRDALANGVGNPDDGLYDSLIVSRYRRDALTGLDVPEKWTIRWMFRGKPSAETVAKLTDVSINSAEALESFSLVPFPEGTRVIDEREPRR